MTDEYRQQLQAQDKIGIPQTPMVVQPIGSMDPLKAYNNADVSSVDAAVDVMCNLQLHKFLYSSRIHLLPPQPLLDFTASTDSAATTTFKMVSPPRSIAAQ